MRKANFDDYEFLIRRLSAEEGGGFLITFPDLPGCISDGESPDEALKNGCDAFEAWISTCISEGRPVPAAGSHRKGSVRFLQRLPRHMHSSLVAAAEVQGTSVNALVMAFVAEGLTRMEMAALLRSRQMANPERSVVANHAAHVVVSANSAVDIEAVGDLANTMSSAAETEPRVFYVKATPPADRSRYSSR